MARAYRCDICGNFFEFDTETFSDEIPMEINKYYKKENKFEHLDLCQFCSDKVGTFLTDMKYRKEQLAKITDFKVRRLKF